MSYGRELHTKLFIDEANACMRLRVSLCVCVGGGGGRHKAGGGGGGAIKRGGGGICPICPPYGDATDQSYELCMHYRSVSVEIQFRVSRNPPCK